MRLEDCGGPQKRRESPCSVDASCRDKKKEVKEAKRTNSKTFQMSLESRHRVKFVTSSLNKAPLLKFWLSCCTEVKHGGAEVAVLTHFFCHKPHQRDVNIWLWNSPLYLSLSLSLSVSQSTSPSLCSLSACLLLSFTARATSCMRPCEDPLIRIKL